MLEAGGAAGAHDDHGGTFGFVATELYLVIDHEVAPKAQARQCSDCHSGGIDFTALGYDADPMAGGTKRHIELLAPFGLDASDPEFWKRGLGVVSGFIDELEAVS